MPASLYRFILPVLCLCALTVNAQTQPPVPPEALSVRVAKLVAPSVVIIKTGTGGAITAQGTGVIVREDGMILTAYHVIKNAAQVQVVLKDGETYDRVELLGVDERRDVAAIRIDVPNLRAIKIRAVTDEQIGEKVFALANPLGMNWTFSDGLLSGVRLADDVPGAGRGFRLLQFTAPASAGSSGGVLVDSEGRGIGLIVGGLNGGQNLNFAVPLAAVAGLIDHRPSKLLGGGLALGQKPPEKEKIEDRTGKAVAVAEANRTERIKEARLIFVQSRTALCKPVMLQNELLKAAAQLDEWQIKIVEDVMLADIVIEVDYMPLTFFYTYSIHDKRAGLVLGAGRVTAWDCNLAAPGLAKGIIKHLRAVHAPPELKKPAQKAQPQKPQ
ncbi:MAG TPA: serine protease [Blastocatellia bacterium]|nr:serine protease [Blastocatellia bacterium]